MAGQISRATKKKPGGLGVIWCRVSRCRTAAPGHEMDAEKDRFSRPKSFPYTADIEIPFLWRNVIENRRENGALVTMRHVFWPNQRRRSAWLLPIWLRNSDLVGHGYYQKAERGGGGSSRRSRQHASIHKFTWNFTANGSPALICSRKKQRRLATVTPDANVGPRQLAPSP
jgi:hypothetical protein